MTVESKAPTEILQSSQVASPELEAVAKQLKKQGKKIKDRVQDYFVRLPSASLFNSRDSQHFYKQANNADKRLENGLRNQIEEVSKDKKLTSEKAMLIRGICAGTIRELNHGITRVHPNNQPFVGQLARRIIMFGTEISDKHFRNSQGNPQIVDRDWLREFAMDLYGLEYTYRLGELGDKLRQFVENPPTQLAD